MGVFFGKLDLSDEVIVSTPKGIETTRSFRRMTEDRQWNPGILNIFVGVPWSPRGITTDALGGIRKRCITRALVQTHGATDGCLCRACQGDGQVHVPKCRKRFEDIFGQEKQPCPPLEVVQQDGPGHAAEQVVPGDQREQMNGATATTTTTCISPRVKCTAIEFESRRDNACQHDAASCKKPR